MTGNPIISCEFKNLSFVFTFNLLRTLHSCNLALSASTKVFLISIISGFPLVFKKIFYYLR
jgi:hypothetical protein